MQRLPLYSQPAEGLMNAVLLLRHLSVASALRVKYFPGHQLDRQPVDNLTWLKFILLSCFTVKLMEIILVAQAELYCTLV